MRYVIVILAVIASLSSYVSAENLIRKVSFIGEKPERSLYLYSQANRLYLPDSLGSDSVKIARWYSDQGWFDCEVIASHISIANGIDIEFEIKKNALYKLNLHLPVTSDDSLNIYAADILSKANSSPARLSNLENLANDLIELYSESGYPYCEIRYDNFRLAKPDSLIATIDLQPGPAVEIERVEFDGVKNIDPTFLERYMGLVTPLKFSSTVLVNAQRRLVRAGFLSEVEQYQLRYFNRPERGIVVFPIREVSPLVLDGAAGYSTNDEEFYGKFNATLSNVLGKGRQMRLEWSKKDSDSRWMKIAYTEPYPFNIPFKASLELYQDDRDSTFIENGASVGLHYLGSDIYSYGVLVGASRLDPESYGRTFLPNKDKLRLSVSLSADSRDYPDNPNEGEYMLLKADFVSETVKADSLFAAANTDYRTAELHTEKLFALSGVSVFYLGVKARGDFSQDVPADRLFALGGFGSLRGYMQDQFFVSRNAILTAEYRLLTSRQGRAYIFTDTAVYQRPKQTGDSSDTEYIAGFGIGLKASVRLGIATIEIAVPSEEGFGDTKLHFGLKAGF